jgi:hypothetical protein
MRRTGRVTGFLAPTLKALTGSVSVRQVFACIIIVIVASGDVERAADRFGWTLSARFGCNLLAALWLLYVGIDGVFFTGL